MNTAEGDVDETHRVKGDLAFGVDGAVLRRISGRVDVHVLVVERRALERRLDLLDALEVDQPRLDLGLFGLQSGNVRRRRRRTAQLNDGFI